MPAIFSTKEELIAICRVVANIMELLWCILRNHDDTITNALEEIIDIAEKSGVKLHISHMRSYNSKYFRLESRSFDKYIEKAAIKE